MKKLLVICFLFLGIMTFVNAQDTIIENKDYYLRISSVTEKIPHYEYIKIGENFEVLEHQWTNGSIRDILKDWMTFLELEEVEYRIHENVSNFRSLMQIVDDEDKGKSIDIKNTTSDIQEVFMGYNVIYQQNEPYQVQTKAITKTAFEVFCNVLNLEIEIIKEPMTYWKLEIIDTVNASFSYDQTTHWKRTDLEEYIYYERIKYRRIADLLGRKVDAFVKPIPYHARKFDIRMPYSDDVFDLKYAMIEHGLELTEVTEEIEVMVIRARE
ncbi:MAG: hypothetical protein AB8G11_01225 [Saprospiraceae bacterium]